MAPNTGKMKAKRSLQRNRAESHDNEQEMQEMSNYQTFTTFFYKEMNHQIK